MLQGSHTAALAAVQHGLLHLQVFLKTRPTVLKDVCAPRPTRLTWCPFTDCEMAVWHCYYLSSDDASNLLLPQDHIMPFPILVMLALQPYL